MSLGITGSDRRNEGALDYIQPDRFPFLRQEIDPLTAKFEQLIYALDTIGIGAYVRAETGGPGGPARRPARHRPRLRPPRPSWAWPSTRALRERLLVDASLRRICGWERRAEIPSEPTFSRALNQFAEEGLVDRIHQALVERSFEGRIVGVVARDTIEIEAMEKPAPKDDDPLPPAGPPCKPGRPRKTSRLRPPSPGRRWDRVSPGGSGAAGDAGRVGLTGCGLS